MPRRKRGRDKPKSTPRRNRTKANLFVLNTTAAWRIGEPKPNFGPDRLAKGKKDWVQIREPFAEERALGETIGWYNVDGRIYLGQPDGKRVGIVI